jgi:AraC-like DNA-binding protein
MGSQSPVNTVSRAAARDLVETCKKRGLISNQRLRQLGWDCPKDHDAASRIPETILIDLWLTIASHDKEQGLGLIVGQTINPEAKGLLASWISQSKNLREALAIFRKNIALMNPSESWELTETNNTATLTFHIKKGRGYPDIAIERSMSAMVTWAQVLSGQSFEIKGAHFSFAAPSYVDKFHAIFGRNISFGCSENQLTMDSGILDLPVVSNNPFLKELIQSKAKQNLAEIQGTLSLQNKVRRLLSDALKAGEGLNISDVSQALAMSRQTLYRQLKEEQIDFQSIQDQVRKDEALKRLKRGQSITNISLGLGYKDTSSFYKAFKRWFGASPKHYLSSASFKE